MPCVVAWETHHRAIEDLTYAMCSGMGNPSQSHRGPDICHVQWHPRCKKFAICSTNSLISDLVQQKLLTERKIESCGYFHLLLNARWQHNWILIHCDKKLPLRQKKNKQIIQELKQRNLCKIPLHAVWRKQGGGGSGLAPQLSRRIFVKIHKYILGTVKFHVVCLRPQTRHKHTFTSINRKSLCSTK